MDLNQTWFMLVGVLIIGYAILDGFDLGVGILHLFSKGDLERRTFMNAIGPVWDGNEVWLVTGGGALFAAFPHAYATSFSGLYIPFMLVLLALIFRAISLEFRSKMPGARWRQTWDVCFFTGSLLASLLFGVAIGNLVLGLPIGDDMEYKGGFFNLLSPYTVLTGLFTIAMFAMHGSIYLYLKTEGELQEKVRGWVYKAFFLFVVLYMATTAFTLVKVPTMIRNFEHFPWMWVIVGLNILAIANIPRALHKGLPFRAFVSSACTIAALVFLFGMGVYPNLIPSSINPAYSLTLYNAASSEKTLKIMLIIAIIGLPFVLSYTAAIYWIFRGKVKIDKFSY